MIAIDIFWRFSANPRIPLPFRSEIFGVNFGEPAATVDRRRRQSTSKSREGASDAGEDIMEEGKEIKCANVHNSNDKIADINLCEYPVRSPWNDYAIKESGSGSGGEGVGGEEGENPRFSENFSIIRGKKRLLKFFLQPIDRLLTFVVRVRELNSRHGMPCCLPWKSLRKMSEFSDGYLSRRKTGKICPWNHASFAAARATVCENL